MRSTSTRSLLAAGMAMLVACTMSAGNEKQPSGDRIGFTENKGQICDQDGKPVPQVLFQLTGSGKKLYVTNEGLTYVFAKKESCEGPKLMPWSKLEMKLAGAEISAANVQCEFPLPGYSNYYYAHCPQGILNVKTFHKVTIRGVYPGIDWVLLADGENVQHDFIVHPGADPDAIRLVYKGYDKLLVLNESSMLKIATTYGTLFEGELKTWTEESGTPVDSRFRVKGEEVCFALGNYNRSETVVIDPPLQWASAQASNGMDYIFAVSALNDGSGDVCAAGQTDGTDFPLLNPTQGGIGGSEDMVIQRLSGASGSRIWSTYYGGNSTEMAKGVATDASGNCYVTGYTASSNFPTQNPIQVGYGGGVFDAAFMKFNSAGVRQWATCYGGTGADQGFAIASDAAGNTYATGFTASSNFPVANAIQGAKSGVADAFIMKMNSASTVGWATFFGGDDDDRGRGIAVKNGSVYVTGSTVSGTFPATTGVFQVASGSAYNAEDAFITKLDTAGTTLDFSSHWGGEGSDFGQGIAVDTANHIYITGYTLSMFPPTVDPGNGAFYVNTLGGGPGMHDGFIAKCDPTGATLIWSTYFGGTGVDLALGIASDPQNGVYITGRSASIDMPMQQPADNVFYQNTQGDGGNFNDFFISWFFNTGELKWSTYYGDANGNEGNGISVNQTTREIFVGGVDFNEGMVLKFGPGPLAVNDGQENLAQLNLYPDPAAEVLNVEFSAAMQAVQVRVLDMQGQVVREWKENAAHGKLMMDVSELSAGVYVLEVRGEKSVEKKKFVKK